MSVPVLAEGAAPLIVEMTVEQTKNHLVINLESAKRLGPTIPTFWWTPHLPAAGRGWRRAHRAIRTATRSIPRRDTSISAGKIQDLCPGRRRRCLQHWS